MTQERSDRGARFISKGEEVAELASAGYRGTFFGVQSTNYDPPGAFTMKACPGGINKVTGNENANGPGVKVTINTASEVVCFTGDLRDAMFTENGDLVSVCIE